ncbi:MAG: porphobilinogen synthase, partial [Alicyclobacillus sp.]|nr:porphobilinogen synthase [Alicyclobacillus sp.]
MAGFRRHRRLRASANLRRMVRETQWSADDLVYPLFVQEGLSGREPVAAMPGVDHLGLDELRREVHEVSELGIPAILLFGVPLRKDECSSSAFAEDGIV